MAGFLLFRLLRIHEQNNFNAFRINYLLLLSKIFDTVSHISFPVNELLDFNSATFKTYYMCK